MFGSICTRLDTFTATKVIISLWVTVTHEDFIARYLCSTKYEHLHGYNCMVIAIEY